MTALVTNPTSLEAQRAGLLTNFANALLDANERTKLSTSWLSELACAATFLEQDKIDAAKTSLDKAADTLLTHPALSKHAKENISGKQQRTAFWFDLFEKAPKLTSASNSTLFANKTNNNKKTNNNNNKTIEHNNNNHNAHTTQNPRTFTPTFTAAPAA